MKREIIKTYLNILAYYWRKNWRNTSFTLQSASFTLLIIHY